MSVLREPLLLINAHFGDKTFSDATILPLCRSTQLLNTRSVSERSWVRVPFEGLSTRTIRPNGWAPAQQARGPGFESH
eukprot:6350318-Amphidinium_carterae.1